MAFAGQLDQPFGNVALAGRRSAAALPGKFQRSLRPGQPQNRLMNQGVVKDDIGLAQSIDRMEGQ